MQHQNEDHSPSRPIKHALLSGTFVLFSLTSLLLLATALTLSAMAPQALSLSFAAENHAGVTNQTPEEVEWWVADDETEFASVKPLPLPSSSNQSSKRLFGGQLGGNGSVEAKTKRPFDDTFKAKVRHFIKSDEVLANDVVRAYLLMEDHYVSEARGSHQRRVGEVRAWLSSARVTPINDDAGRFLQQLQTQLIGDVRIQYNRDRNLVSLIAKKQRLQCQSASVALALAALSQVLPKGWLPIFVHSPGHVQFGILRDQQIFVVESTGLTSGVLDTNLEALQNRIVTNAKLELLQTMATLTNLGKTWQESLWSKAVVIMDARDEKVVPGLDFVSRFHHEQGRPDGPSLTNAWGKSDTPPGDRLRHDVGTPKPSSLVCNNQKGLRDTFVTFDIESAAEQRDAGESLSDLAGETLGINGRVDLSGLSVDTSSMRRSRFRKGGTPTQVSPKYRRYSAFPKRKVAVTVTVERVFGAGVLDKQRLQDKLRKHSRRFAYCYRKALRTKPKLANTIVGILSIRENGRVESVKVTKGSEERDNFQRCVVRCLRLIRSPKPQGGAVKSQVSLYFDDPER